MMLGRLSPVAAVLLLHADAALSLRAPAPAGARAAAAAAALSDGPAAAVGRRAAVFSAAAAALSLGVSGAVAYDAIPVVEPDFAAMEKARMERDAKSRKLTAQLNEKFDAVFAAKNEEQWIAACDDVALWVIGSGAVPEGVKIKAVVGELKKAYGKLPQKKFPCESTRTNQGICYTPGKGAELAFESMLKELRKYSIIQLGDYRRVEFNAF